MTAVRKQTEFWKGCKSDTNTIRVEVKYLPNSSTPNNHLIWEDQTFLNGWNKPSSDWCEHLCGYHDRLYNLKYPQEIQVQIDCACVKKFKNGQERDCTQENWTNQLSNESKRTLWHNGNFRVSAGAFPAIPPPLPHTLLQRFLLFSLFIALRTIFLRRRYPAANFPNPMSEYEPLDYDAPNSLLMFTIDSDYMSLHLSPNNNGYTLSPFDHSSTSNNASGAYPPLIHLLDHPPILAKLEYRTFPESQCPKSNPSSTPYSR